MQMLAPIILLGLASPAATGLQDTTTGFVEDFESGPPGASPDGWMIRGAGEDSGLVEVPEGSGQCVYFEQSGSGFANLARSTELAGLEGHGVRLSARVRVAAEANTTGRAQLWLRFDYEDGTSALADNCRDRPVTAGDWTEQVIVANVAAKPGVAVLGVMGHDGASVWVDDVRLEDLGPAPGAAIEPSRSIDDIGMANLTAFTKLFGVVRYFHPSDEVEAQDWEQFAIDGVRRVEGAKDPEDLANVLRDMFRDVAPTLRIGTEGGEWVESPDLARPEGVRSAYLRYWQHAGVGLGGPPYSSIRKRRRVRGDDPLEGLRSPTDYEEIDLGRGILARVPLSLWGDRSVTFPVRAEVAAVPAAAGWELTGDLQSPFTGDDRGTRLGAVVLAWNLFQHFYPYFDVVETDWDGELTAALVGAATAGDGQAFGGTLERLVAGLHDGHGRVSWRQSERLGVLPFALAWSGERAVVAALPDRSESGLKPGDVILEFAGETLAEVASRKLETISTATPQWGRARLKRALLQGPFGEEVELKVLRVEEELLVTCAFGSEMPPSWPQPRDVVEEVEPGYWYIDLGRLTTEDYTGRLTELSAAKGIVFDLRGYPRISPFEFFAHIIDKTAHSAWWRVPVTSRPNRTDVEWRESHWTIEPKEPHIGAKLAFLTGGGAISFAESCMAIVEAYGLAEIVGGPTAGTNGNVNPFSVPGGYRISWTGMKVDKHDRTPHHGVGVLPTIPIEPTPEGIAAGRDEVFEAGLAAVK